VSSRLKIPLELFQYVNAAKEAWGIIKKFQIQLNNAEPK